MVLSSCAKTPEEGARFDAAMSTYTRTSAVFVCKSFNFSSFKTIVDVAGGHGQLLMVNIKKVDELFILFPLTLKLVY